MPVNLTVVEASQKLSEVSIKKVTVADKISLHLMGSNAGSLGAALVRAGVDSIIARQLSLEWDDVSKQFDEARDTFTKAAFSNQ